jgi:GT2 family glycosyltransferase
MASDSDRVIVRPSILATIVLYKTGARDSASVASLARAADEVGKDGVRLKVLLFDNGPRPSGPAGLFAEEVYVSAPENAGLVHAYNAGLKMAMEEGFEWLLTLDQDTSLPEEFLAELARGIALVEGDPQVAAIVPQMRGAGRALSPYRFRWGAFPVYIPRGSTGVPDCTIYSLNSASLLRVSALRQIGGYDPRFWLDASDHAIFHTLAAHGKRVYVAGGIQVEHHLSLVEDGGAMPAERYRNILAAEFAFWDMNMSRLANWERNLRLMMRLSRQFRGESKELRTISLEFLGRRFFHSRKYRLRKWDQEIASRRGGAFADPTAEPMVSVCMATYNSENFIGEQIQSILPQLKLRDELIIVDDASTDGTRQRIREIGDPRIKLIEQEANRGVVETFEHAVRSATGDVLFLCDGDDIWAMDKVSKVLHAFAENPQADVVCTGLKLIDERGNPLDSGERERDLDFTAALLPNLIRNRFQGSAMAFRSSLLKHVLPFPKRRPFLHDAWIGACNTLVGGSTIYIAEPLLFYRRHSSNFSGPMGAKGRLVKRIQLVCALGGHWLRSPRN